MFATQIQIKLLNYCKNISLYYIYLYNLSSLKIIKPKHY